MKIIIFILLFLAGCSHNPPETYHDRYKENPEAYQQAIYMFGEKMWYKQSHNSLMREWTEIDPNNGE